MEAHKEFENLVERLLDAGFFLEQAVEMLERKLIQRAMERTNGNRSQASKLLGIHRNTLQRKMADYKLEAKTAANKTPVRKPMKRAAHGSSGARRKKARSAG